MDKDTLKYVMLFGAGGLALYWAYTQGYFGTGAVIDKAAADKAAADKAAADKAAADKAAGSGGGGTPPAPTTVTYADFQAYAASDPAFASGATYDQWNWVFGKLKKTNPPNITIPGDRSAKVSLDDYWALLTSNSLASGTGLSGLGKSWENNIWVS
jgi:type IV secretory pathway TrbL component